MKRRNSKTQDANRFAFDGLDRLIHERARLSVLTSLMAHPTGLPFSDIKELCGLTDGNLSCHLRVLEDADLIDVSRGSEFNRPQTVYRMSPAGRKRYLEYLAILEQVLLDAAAAVKVNADSINTDRKGVRAPARG